MKFSTPATPATEVAATVTGADGTAAEVTDAEPGSDADALVTREVPGQTDANTTHELLYLMLREMQRTNELLEKR